MDVLEKSGQHEEALSELESTLSAHDRIDPRAILGLLSAYARLAKRKGNDIPAAHRDLVMRAVAAWGISVPADVLGSSLTGIVAYASLQEREAQERYTSLVQELRHQTQEVRSGLLEEFTRVEQVGFYRELAGRMRDPAGAPR